MSLMDAKDLAKDVFVSFFCGNGCRKYWKSAGISLSIVFNVLSTIFCLTSLELLRSAVKVSEIEDKSPPICHYIAHTAMSILFRCLCRSTFGYFSEEVARDLTVRFLRDAMNAEYKDIVGSDSGEIIADIQTKLVVYRHLFEMLALKSVSIMAFVVFSVVKIRNSGHPLLYFFTLVYPCAYLLIGAARLRPILRHHTSYLNEKAANSSILYDKMQNFELIKAYGIEEKQSSEFYRKAGRQQSEYFKMKVEGEKSIFLVESFSELPSIAIVLTTSLALPARAVSLSTIFIIFKNLNTLLRQTSDLISGLAISLNGIGVLPAAPARRSVAKKLVFNDSIRFESISAYQGDVPILRNVTLRVQKGDKIAIVGRNGTGKSTLIKTLLRFSRYEGRITIDGQDISDIPGSSLFDLIGYVSQSDYISDATILDNIRMGSKDATADDIAGTAALLGIHSEIMSLRKGYDTSAGFNGSSLSAGQRKKISILRAFVKRSPILVLDEATATVDKNYEDYFVRSALREIKSRTVLMIIHQKELIKYFEKVIFLKDGTVEEYGKFDDVYRKSKAFREFMTEKCQ